MAAQNLPLIFVCVEQKLPLFINVQVEVTVVVIPSLQ